jgi:hypothetical protein
MGIENSELPLSKKFCTLNLFSENLAGALLYMLFNKGASRGLHGHLIL